MLPDAREQPQHRVHLENRHIVFVHGDEVLVRIPVDEIKLIGEYTTGNGPLIDDWFIVFMTSATDWKHISEYTPGMQKMLQELGQLLDAEIVGSLSWSTSWITNIIWPPSVAEVEMWDVRTQLPETLWQKLRARLGMGSDQTLVLTQAANSVFH
jgi:hypothetical protein